MMNLIPNKNYKAVCGAVFAFLVCAGSFVPTPVHADLTTSDIWNLVNAGLVSSPAVTALKNSVVEQYTSLSPGELSMLEYEVGAVMAVGSVVLAQDWALENGVQYDGISGAYTMVGLSRYTNSNNLLEIVPASWTVSPSGGIFNSDPGSFACLPAVLNGATPRTFNSSGGSGSSAFVETRFIIPGSSDFQASFNCSGVIDGHSGLGTFTNRTNCVVAVGGYLRDTGWIYGEQISNPVTWDTNYTSFYQSQTPIYMLNYITNMQWDDVAEPIDLYNQAYQKALNDYPEYIDNWVDLEDDFTGETPSVFDSLEFPPYIPEVDFHDVEIPSETLPTGLTDGAGFWFSAFSTMVEAFNLKSFVILFLCIMLLMVILKI